MAHFWKKTFEKDASMESIIREEVKCLRNYALECKERNQLGDAIQALSSAIELSHFSLQKWKCPSRKENKRMREILSDLREYLKLSVLNDGDEEDDNKKKTDGKCLVDFESLSMPLASQSDEIKKLYAKFSSCVKISAGDNKVWDSVVGNEDAKEIILKSLEYPILFQNMGQNKINVNGLLLYGPPGTGKSMIARAVADKVRLPFLELEVKDIMSKYQGESEQNVAEFFKLARALKPCVVFIDEIDSLLGKRSTDSDAPEARRGVTNQLLHATQGSPGLFIIGATNTPWQIDSAFLRRFDFKCYVRLPRFEDRKEMFVRFLKENPNSILASDVDLYAHAFAGRSGSEIYTFLKKVSMRQASKLDEGKYFAKDRDGIWFLCNKYHPNAQKITFREICSLRDRYRLPYVSVMDFDLVAMDKNTKPSEIRRYEDFSVMFG